MINVMVSYKVKPEFVHDNNANIQRFLKDFAELNTTPFRFEVFTKTDGVTFVHCSSTLTNPSKMKSLTPHLSRNFRDLGMKAGWTERTAPNC
ncbi:hypothetical protein Q31a_17170 [Aureliella helgolandensis]|uniref:Uncharacterized protein n=1 Tax=Aureliella helgolandensis TaxID=2527968 RepID=A0A518G4E9_9BACT|nr:hypothetical protein Q31a_17170 [Aureliella helgolandensis]